MTERKFIRPIAILVIGVLATLYMVRTCNDGPRISELDVERQYSRDVSVPVTGAPILSLKRDEISTANNTIGQHDRLLTNDLSGLSEDSENISHAQACGSEWLDDGLTVQEMLHCVEGNASGKNSSQED